MSHSVGLVVTLCCLALMLLLCRAVEYETQTHYIVSKTLYCSEQQIEPNPCYGNGIVYEKPIIIDRTIQNYTEIFIDQYRYINIPSEASMVIEYFGRPIYRCVIDIIPHNTIINISTLLSQPILSRVNSNPEESISVYYAPSSSTPVTLYGFVSQLSFQNERDFQETISISCEWRPVNGEVLESQNFNMNQYYKKFEVIPLQLELPPIVHFYRFSCSQGIQRQLSIQFQLIRVWREMNECEEVSHMKSALCKRGAQCTDVFFGYHCAWPINSSNTAPFPYIAPRMGFQEQWYIPNPLTRCKDMNIEFKNILCKREAIFVIKEISNCLHVANCRSSTIYYQCSWYNESVQSTETPYILGACESRSQGRFICPEITDYIEEKPEEIFDEIKEIEDKRVISPEIADAKMNKLTNIITHVDFSKKTSKETIALTKETMQAVNKLIQITQDQKEGITVKTKGIELIEFASIQTVQKLVQENKNEPVRIELANVLVEIRTFDIEKQKEPWKFTPSKAERQDDQDQEEEISITPKSEESTSNGGEPIGVVFTRMANTMVPAHMNISLISNSLSATLTKPINVTLQFKLNHAPLNGSEKRLCGYLRFTKQAEMGQWKTDGCRIKDDSSPTATVCECDHLTHFGILLDLSGTFDDISEDVKKLLEAISYIGCIICIIALCMFLYVALRVLKNEKRSIKFIYISLSVCLLLGNLMFVIGIDRTENAIVCAIMAGCIQYFFLAAFSWKLIFGLLATYSVLQTKEFRLSNKSRIVSFIGGFGAPAIIVGITAAVRPTAYEKARYCWLSNKDFVLLSFYIPIVVVIVINFVNIGIIFGVLFRSYLRSVKFQYKSKFQLMFLIQATLCMGLTWLFGLFMFDKVSTMVFSHLFAIANALQGVMIFVVLVIVPVKSRQLCKQHVSSFLSIITTGSTFTQSESRSSSRSKSSKHSYLVGGNKFSSPETTNVHETETPLMEVSKDSAILPVQETNESSKL